MLGDVALKRGGSHPSGRPAGRAKAPVRHDLQGLRGVAVLGVVVYHLRSSWLPGGFAGVDVFFVLSGFFITGLLLREIDRRGRVDLLAFWGRRARRLLPAAALVVVTTVLAARWLTNPLEAHRIARDGVYATLFGMNWHEAASGLAYGQDPNPSPFQHFWSLGVEEQFYLAWPVLVLALALLCRSGRRWGVRRALVGLGLVLGVLSFVLAYRQTAHDQPYAYYGTVGRIWQLAVGGVLAATVARVGRLPEVALLAARVAGLALIIGFYVLAPADLAYPGWYSIVPTAGAALVVAAGVPGAVAARREPVARLLGSRAGGYLGRYSYGWYLWHWPPLVLLPIALDRPLRIRELGECALGTFALAVLTYHLLENPVRTSRWLAARHGGRSLRLGALLLALAVLTSLWTSAATLAAATHAHVAERGHALIPQPAAAAAQVPTVSKDGCQVALTAPGLSPECRFLPDRGHGDVVLVGDSHAGMWFPAVYELAKQNDWGLRVWARTSCPISDIQKPGPGGTGTYSNCRRWLADVMQRLIADRPSLVIVASYAGVNLNVLDPTTHTRAGQAAAHRLFEAGMVRDLASLRAAGLAVLLIGDVPSYQFAAPDCVLAHEQDLSACSAPEAQALPYGGVDLAAARSVPGVQVADFTPSFCHRGRCYQVVGDILAYRDLNHLTTQMAMSLAPQLNRAARSAVARAGRVR